MSTELTELWRPLVWDLFDLRDEMNRALSAFFDGWREEWPRMNAWVSDDEVVLDVELPGVDPKAVDISLVKQVLTISGRRDPESAAEGETVHRQERHHGPFSRSVTLPYRPDAAKVSATYKNGILRITVPRLEADKPRRIAIQSG